MKPTSKLSTNKATFALSIAFVVFVVLLVVNLSVVFVNAAKDRQNLELVSELRALSYRVSGLSRDATNGNETAFKEMRLVLDQMDKGWFQLRGNSDGLPDNVLASYQNALEGVQEQANNIISDKETILFLNEVVNILNERLPLLQEEHTQVVEILLDSRAPADQVAVAQAQSWRAERIGRNVDKMLAGGEDAEKAADQFNRDANLFGRVLEGMKKGDPALGIGQVTAPQALKSLNRITDQFEFVSNSIQEIFDATPALFRARQATESILDLTPALLESGAVLSDAIADSPDNRFLSNRSALVVGIIAAILLALIGFQVYAATRHSLKETAETNEKNQQAILRLLDEIEGLGDGDLTAEATVTADFTGAIADAINFAILQLRELVARIQDTAENVSAAANETRATALQLADSSEHQAQEIAGASQSINDMAVTIDQVSERAVESANVAKRSVTIATNGANVVQGNIKGMDTIREQIQDTAKRIKRLGESSQEIGDIVSLISDIADQTNILALNAAIQASMAGDAGRGFAVVADEVQRLAERSAGAAKQVASLVKTIQTDTNEAVSSMEQTTSEVVKGAQLAHDAGSALEEIQTVSASLADLIQDISTAARHQANTAGQISRTMNVIQDITSQTTAGSKNTASSIGELAEMAVELREFVADFKLPATTMATKHQAADRGFGVSGLSEVHNLLADDWEQEAGQEELEVAAAGIGDEAVTNEVSTDIASAKEIVEPAAETSFEEPSEDRELKEPVLATSDQVQQKKKHPTLSELEAELATVDLSEFNIDEPGR